jgi:hypothetical protein
MNAATPLERRYRRLLSWYPAAHRAAYGEEMIGVLLAASDNRQRPGLADTADLVKGAVHAWWRDAVTSAPDPGWRDALGAASLLATPLMIVLALGQDRGWMASLLSHSAPETSSLPSSLWPFAILLLPLALGLLGLRRTAAVAAALLMTWVAVQAALGHRLQEPRVAGYLLLFGVQVVALAVSPGPRRGLELVSGRAILPAIPWLAAAAYAGGIVPTHYPVPLVVAEVGIGLLALAGLPALAAPAGRRLLVLLVVIPGSAFVVSLLTFSGVDFYAMSFAASQAALYLPATILACLTALAARRPGRDRSADEAGAGGTEGS